MSGPGCASMQEYYRHRSRRRLQDGVELPNPEPPREHIDLGDGCWLTVRAGLSAAKRELLRLAARDLVDAVAANPELLPRPGPGEMDGGRRGD